ncbi:DUF5995 family protein [Kitasatospora sp. GP82]|uniref:DUF5995 family protein n=1 Tax=Kitasatospora sp. GP82 TaxID=3035089 RepID=UPI0024771224|nr:DUF5995 family protein [Kitasatospora sp. GP82]MDH6129691.1 hypothetical protein [Kitasatospora sp. GP82]
MLPEELAAPSSRPWRDVYAASSARHSYVLEDVLFSMMAHMSYDLPLALRRMAEREDPRSHIADFERMNEVLDSSIEEVEDHVAARYCRGLAFLDHLFTRGEKLLTGDGIRVVRGLAWFNLDRLLDPQPAEAAKRSIERSTAVVIAEARCARGWKLRLVQRVVRRLVPARRQRPPAGSQMHS